MPLLLNDTYLTYTAIECSTCPLDAVHKTDDRNWTAHNNFPWHLRHEECVLCYHIWGGSNISVRLTDFLQTDGVLFDCSNMTEKNPQKHATYFRWYEAR